MRLIEFAYNDSYHSSIGMVPYEALKVDHVDHLSVGPKLGVVRFDKKEKLAEVCWAFEILEKVGKLALPTSMSDVHNVFYISMLRKYDPDVSHM